VSECGRKGTGSAHRPSDETVHLLSSTSGLQALCIMSVAENCAHTHVHTHKYHLLQNVFRSTRPRNGILLRTVTSPVLVRKGDEGDQPFGSQRVLASKLLSLTHGLKACVSLLGLLGGVTSRNSRSHGSGRQPSEIRCQQGWVLVWRLWG